MFFSSKHNLEPARYLKLIELYWILDYFYNILRMHKYKLVQLCIWTNTIFSTRSTLKSSYLAQKQSITYAHSCLEHVILMKMSTNSPSW